MPVSPTYPGVYIEEVPNPVRTIVGVATSITAFVGYTRRGPLDDPIEVFNFGDFERTFGGLDVDCPLTYSVQQFFLNGGTDAIIVRVAKDAAVADVTLRNSASNGAAFGPVLALEARTAGQWGNALQVEVDRDTLNPLSLFNLTVTEVLVRGGRAVTGRVETFRNLTLNSKSPTYAVDTINANSKLLAAVRPALPGTFAAGTSTGKALTSATVPVGTGPKQLAVSLRGRPSVILDLTTAINGASVARSALANLINAAAGNIGLKITATVGGNNKLVLTDNDAGIGEDSSVHVFPAAGSTLATALGIGVGQGGAEVDAIAPFLPASTATTAAVLADSLPAGGVSQLASTTGDRTLKVTIGTAPAVTVTVLKKNEALASTEELRAHLEAAIQATALANPTIGDALAGTRVQLLAARLVVRAGGSPATKITFQTDGADTLADALGLTTGAVANIGAYSPAIGTLEIQEAGALGSDGTAPDRTALIGDEVKKTGMQALADADIFNLLVLPDELGTDNSVISAGLTLCEQHRAMLIVDLPSDKTSLAQAHDWIADPATPKSANGAAFFPRPQIPDPLQEYRPRKMPGGGAIAGLFARTDGTRGVWKAPAGTEAVLRGPTGVDTLLTDPENGKLNPLGLNAVRSLPVHGNVVWGSRTLVGSDLAASQWKYIPVRRTALYIEESLFRGTQWVVFEPNDEPLWAQIRLNIGAFMHGLFRKGAFQGASPRKAYLVKCDSETTTQADIDQGIVNILVGFAPLKPAEFVVLRISQLAGQLDV